MIENGGRPLGRMELRVRAPDGRLVAVRRSTNVVLRRGAEIVGRLFAGADGAGPVDRLAVGFGREALDAEATALSPPPGGGIDPDALVGEVAQDDFTVLTDRPGFVRVSVASVFRPSVDLTGVSEAGLMAGDDLYNQVVFELVDLSVGQDVTFFWDIDFPFGN